MIFTRFAHARRSGSALALALTLAATGTVGAAVFAQPAHAAKKEKEEKPAKAEYSKEFITAYKPIEGILNAKGDIATIKPLLPALLATVQSSDEKKVAGGLLLNVGNQTDDAAMRLQGLEMMLASGKLDAATTGQLSFASYQAYLEAKDYAKARTALDGAIAANYSFDATMTDGSQRVFGADDMRKLAADIYFDQGQYAEGLNYLSSEIAARKAAGQPVPEMWIRHGLATAFENNIGDQSGKFSAMLVSDYPTPAVWGDAIVITMNSNNYTNAEVLDLMRLARRMKAYNDPRVLSEYVEVLDARRYPGEVLAVIDEGYALGVIQKSDPYLAETRKEAAGRVDIDKRELAGLAADARKSGATLKTLVEAGDTFLSYDRPAEAEEFYTKALATSGADTPVVLTRLGIAQYDQGKYAEAQDTFKKIEGPRRDLAALWEIHTKQKAGS